MDKIKDEKTVIEHITEEAMIDDPLTKCLASKFFNEHVVSMGVLVLLMFWVVGAMTVMTFI